MQQKTGRNPIVFLRGTVVVLTLFLLGMDYYIAPRLWLRYLPWTLAFSVPACLLTAFATRRVFARFPGHTARLLVVLPLTLALVLGTLAWTHNILLFGNVGMACALGTAFGKLSWLQRKDISEA